MFGSNAQVRGVTLSFGQIYSGANLPPFSTKQNKPKQTTKKTPAILSWQELALCSILSRFVFKKSKFSLISF